MKALIAAAALAIAGCATLPTAPNRQDAFFARLSALCGQRLTGRLVSSDSQDAAMASQPLVAEFHQCVPSEVRIRFSVGKDESRNWVVTRTPGGLRLKHIHLHEDGSEDRLSRYGGDTVGPGTERRQEFPADAFSRDLFVRLNLPQSLPNVWAIEAGDGVFVYELRRPGRFFRVEFDRPAGRRR